MTNFDNIGALSMRVPDGAFIALPAEYSWVSASFARALIVRGVRDLHVLCVPIGGITVDMLIGAGCVNTIEAAAVSLGEAGLAPRFTDAVQSGSIRVKDSTCPAIHAGLQAAEKGVPFMPLGGLIGSDIEANREDWRVVPDPMDAGNGPIALVSALKPDFTIFHSPKADRHGNVWIGKRRELVVMAHAAKETLVTVEEIVDEDFLADEATASGTLGNLYVSAIAEVKNGAWPSVLHGVYEADREEIATYAYEAKTAEGFQAFMDRALTHTRLVAAE